MLFHSGRNHTFLRGGRDMAAYIVAQLDVKNTNWQKEYGPKAGAGSTLERLEGKGQLPSVMFLLEFPSLEQAKAWYNDPEYAHMIHLRQTGADANIVVL